MKKTALKITSTLLATLFLLSAPLTAFAANGPLPVDPEWMPAWGRALVELSDQAAGKYYDIFSGDVTDNEALTGATYDKATNTLTLNNVDMPGASLSLHMMGDDFKLDIEGECALGVIYVNDYEYSTSLTITGKGVLNINKEQKFSNAISLYGGEAQKSVSIDKSVTVNMYSPESSKVIFKTSECKNSNTNTVFTVDGKPVDGLVGMEKIRVEYDWVNAARKNINDNNSYYRGERVISKADPDGIYAVISYTSNPNIFYVTRYKYYAEFDLYNVDYDFAGEGRTNVKLTKEEFENQYKYPKERQSYYTYGSYYAGEMEIYYDGNGKKYLSDGMGNAYTYDEEEIIVIGGEPYYVARYAEGTDLSTLNDTKVNVPTGLYEYTLKGTSFTHDGEAAALTLGDVNANGYLDIGDATTIQYHLADLLDKPLTAQQQKAADTNGNNIIDIGDATTIQYYLADLIEGF